jgi:hypothetical protein
MLLLNSWAINGVGRITKEILTVLVDKLKVETPFDMGLLQRYISQWSFKSYVTYSCLFCNRVYSRGGWWHQAYTPHTIVSILLLDALQTNRRRMQFECIHIYTVFWDSTSIRPLPLPSKYQSWFSSLPAIQLCVLSICRRIACIYLSNAHFYYLVGFTLEVESVLLNCCVSTSSRYMFRKRKKSSKCS